MNILKKIALGIILVSVILIGGYFWVSYYPSFFLPYSAGPDIQGFVDSQKTSLWVQANDPIDLLTTTQAKITLKTFRAEKVWNLAERMDVQTIDDETFTLFFSSKTGLVDTHVYLLFADGRMVTLLPQSMVEIQGNQLVGSGVVADVDFLKNIYNEKKTDYLIKQIGGEVMLNPKVDGFIKRYLNVMYSLVGGNYGQRILNYQAFHDVLPYGSLASGYEKIDSSQKTLSETSQGYSTTMTKKRIDTIKNLFRK